MTKGKPAMPGAKAADRTVTERQTGTSRRGVGLRGKMILAMLVVALVPLMLFGYFIYKNSYDNLYLDSRDRIKNAAESLGSQVSEWYQLTLRAATVTAQIPDVQSMDAKLALPILKAVNSQYPWIYNIKIHDPAGDAIARSDDAKLKNYSDRYYFQEAMKGKETVWQTLIGKTSKKATLVAACPIRRDGEIVGVSVASSTIDKVRQWIADWKAGKTGYAALIEPNGKIIVHPDKTLYENQVNLADQGHPLAVMFSKGRTGELQYTRADGVEMIGYVTSTPMGWGVIVEQETDEALGLVQTMEKYFLIFFAAAVLISILLGLLFSRQITRPIIYLTKVAEELSLGKLNAKVEVKSSDEINKLAEAISRLQVSMQLAMQRLKTKQ